MKTMHIRASELILDRVLNPAKASELGSARPDDLVEACGLIPDFFADACITLALGDDSADANLSALDDIADRMDAIYGCGGFAAHPYGGTVAADGTYSSPHHEDEALPPLCRFGFKGTFHCFVYQYGITAIRDNTTGEYKVARFD